MNYAKFSQKQELKNWRGFALHPNYVNVVVSYDAVPVTREKANGRSEAATAAGITSDDEPMVDRIRAAESG